MLSVSDGETVRLVLNCRDGLKCCMPNSVLCYGCGVMTRQHVATSCSCNFWNVYCGSHVKGFRHAEYGFFVCGIVSLLCVLDFKGLPAFSKIETNDCFSF